MGRIHIHGGEGRERKDDGASGQEREGRVKIRGSSGRAVLASERVGVCISEEERQADSPEQIYITYTEEALCWAWGDRRGHAPLHNPSHFSDTPIIIPPPVLTPSSTDCVR